MEGPVPEQGLLHLLVETKLNRYRLFRSDGHGRQPIVAVSFFAADHAVELLLNRFRDDTDLSFADRDFVDRTDGGNFGGSAAEENLVSDVERFARDLLLDDFDAEIEGDLHHRIARDAGKNGVAERRRLQHAVADDEYVFARPLADVAVYVERDAFGVAVDNGFHFNELRVHVIRACLGNGGQRVGRDAGPGRDAYINALAGVGSEIFSPWIIADVNLGRRI